jgi:hypothetical protein
VQEFSAYLVVEPADVTSRHTGSARKAPMLKRRRPDAEQQKTMGSLLNALLGAGLAVAIVLGFWLLVSLIDDLRPEPRRKIR